MNSGFCHLFNTYKITSNLNSTFATQNPSCTAHARIWFSKLLCDTSYLLASCNLSATYSLYMYAMLFHSFFHKVWTSHTCTRHVNKLLIFHTRTILFPFIFISQLKTLAILYRHVGIIKLYRNVSLYLTRSQLFFHIPVPLCNMPCYWCPIKCDY